MDLKYRDLEHLLFKGFIPLKVNIEGINLVFKSVNDNEYEKIKLMSGFEKDPRYAFLFNINYLFYSIYMIDGINFLKNREDQYFDFFAILKSCPTVFFKNIQNIVDILVTRQNECSFLVEPYSYELESRFHWENLKGGFINSPSKTSIEGTDLMGLNQFQKYWTVLNLKEDRRDKFETDYSLFKFLASFTDSKAVKKVDASDTARKEEEQKRREKIRSAKSSEDLKYYSAGGKSESAEELVEQLNKQVKGEKDAHDFLIERYEKNLRKDMLKRMNEINKVKEMRKKQDSDFGEEVRAISKEEMIAKMEEIKKRKDKFLGNMTDVSNNQSSKFYQMSNVKDDELIKEENFMSEEEYKVLKENEQYKSLTGENVDAEEEYIRQQSILASKHNLDDGSSDFPHLKR